MILTSFPIRPGVAKPSRWSQGPVTTLTGEIIDSQTRKALAARLYIEDVMGRWHFARSADYGGSAVPFHGERETGIDIHTTLSSHPFVAELPPGKYKITVERGKEYHPYQRTIMVRSKDLTITVELVRWVNMAALGWYSGETHFHRALEELPNVMMAEDLNVGFPCTFGETNAMRAPRPLNGMPYLRQGPLWPKADRIMLDPTPVMQLINSEYETLVHETDSGTVCLGGLLVLNQRKPLRMGMPPMRPVLEEVRRQGALVDFFTHQDPWSLMLLPNGRVDLFELADNRFWRTGDAPLRNDGMDRYKHLSGIERDRKGVVTERGYLDFIFNTYYALLNCGFRLAPSAGVASGVMPCPVGFSRVYVHLPEGFSYPRWISGLRNGRSFVTNGPMLFLRVNGKDPAHAVIKTSRRSKSYHVKGRVLSATPLDRVEIIVNGEIARRIRPANRKTGKGAFESRIHERIRIETSSWIAARCFEKGKHTSQRYAHTAPIHIRVPGKPLRPRRHEVESLIQRVETDLKHIRNWVKKESWGKIFCKECEAGLRFYHKLRKRAAQSEIS